MNEFDTTPSDDGAIENLLGQALSSRAERLRPTDGSMRDVRLRARRHSQRRAVAGVGALAVLGAVGAVALVNRDAATHRLVPGQGAGDGSGSLDGSAVGGYWECTGPLDEGQLQILAEQALYDRMIALNGLNATFPDVTVTTILQGGTSTTFAETYTTATTVPSAGSDPSMTIVTTVGNEGAMSTTQNTFLGALDASVTTSTLAPTTTLDVVSATSVLPSSPATSPFPEPELNSSQVYLMQDCTFVDAITASSDAGVIATVEVTVIATVEEGSTDTFPAVLDPASTEAQTTDTVPDTVPGTAATIATATDEEIPASTDAG